MRRELAIVFRARATWLALAGAALLVGHGVVLAADVFGASSRSALASALQSREMDPLAGLVRPTLGGTALAIALLVPLVSARPIALEKERGTYAARCVAMASTTRVVLEKSAAGILGALAFVVPPLVLLTVVGMVGAHLDPIETGVALLGEVLRALVVASIATAAAAWTRSLAQAATVAIAVSLGSWAIDAADGFAALAWLGGAAAWSLDARLAPFARGVVSIGSLAWLAVGVVGSLGLAVVGGSYAPPRRRFVASAAIVGVAALSMFAASRVHRAYDWTEQRRASLPPAVVAELRSMPEPIEIEIFLDGDDSRRRQLESDVIPKLTLARPDLVLRTPLDERDRRAVERDEDYGRIVVHAGTGSRETRSTSRREIVTLVLEAGGRGSIPSWDMPPYPGYPAVIQGGRRAALAIVAYIALPLTIVAIGVVLSRRRTSR